MRGRSVRLRSRDRKGADWSADYIWDGSGNENVRGFGEKQDPPRTSIEAAAGVQVTLIRVP